MKFRIKQTKGGYHAQVKTSLFSGWKRIGDHSNGFGLYPESSDNWPLTTENEALERCLKYKEFFSKSKSKPKYTYLSI